MDININRSNPQETSGGRPAAPPVSSERVAVPQGVLPVPAPKDTYSPSEDITKGDGHGQPDNPLAQNIAGGLRPDSKEAQDRRDDEEMLRNCPPGCGCGSCQGSGDNPLKAFEDRDQEVRTHESAHQSEAGEFALGGPTFDMKTSKSGKSFAVGGKVNVDTSEIKGDPRKTVAKMQKIQKAALAPVSPSGQDLIVASEASAKEAKAQSELKES
jgi:hypothetical protein